MVKAAAKRTAAQETPEQQPAVVPPLPALLQKPAGMPDRTSSDDFRAQQRAEGLLRKLDRHAMEHEGTNHVQHEAIVALISRLSTVKHHLARLAGMHFDDAIDADLAALARLL